MSCCALQQSFVVYVRVNRVQPRLRPHQQSLSNLKRMKWTLQILTGAGWNRIMLCTAGLPRCLCECKLCADQPQPHKQSAFNIFGSFRINVHCIHCSTAPCAGRD